MSAKYSAYIVVGATAAAFLALAMVATESRPTDTPMLVPMPPASPTPARSKAPVKVMHAHLDRLAADLERVRLARVACARADTIDVRLACLGEVHAELDRIDAELARGPASETGI